MSKLILLFLLFFNLTLCAQEWSKDDIITFDQFDDMAYIFETSSDSLFLINFWATWCKPCVQELPYIEEVAKQKKDDAFKSILVSLDFEKDIETKLVPFLNKNNIQSEVILLLDGKSSRWIDLVDPQWSGAIPITLLIKKGKKNFMEQVFHSTEEILTEIKNFK